MPKPTSASQNALPAPANASGTTKPLPRGSLATCEKSPAITAGERDLALRKASESSGSESELSKSSSASTEAADPQAVTPVPITGPRVSIGTALCEAGFDERAVADQYVKVVQSLGRPDSTDRGGATKLLVDVLKECSRQLDSTAGHRTGDAPVVVQLVHTVSRPVRPAPALTSANPAPPIEIAAPPAAESSTESESPNPSTEPS